MTNEELDAFYAKKYRVKNKKIKPIEVLPLRLPVFAPLAPTTLDEYIGQDSAKTLIRILVEAALKENRPIPNIMFSGTAGLGKTTLAKIVYKDTFHQFTDGSSVNTNKDKLFSKVIIDEIHNLKPDVCDYLNLPLDSGALNILGCTTNVGMLPSPFRSRFRIINLTPYTVDNLVTIMAQYVERRGNFQIEESLLREVAKRARSTPRTARKYLDFILDIMIVRNLTVLTKEVTDEALTLLGLDETGLLDIDRKYLECFPTDGRSVGLQYLSARLATDKETIEQEIEPYLLSLGLIDRTSKGRKRLDTNREDSTVRLARNLFGSLNSGRL